MAYLGFGLRVYLSCGHDFKTSLALTKHRVLELFAAIFGILGLGLRVRWLGLGVWGLGFRGVSGIKPETLNPEPYLKLRRSAGLEQLRVAKLELKLKDLAAPWFELRDIWKRKWRLLYYPFRV